MGKKDFRDFAGHKDTLAEKRKNMSYRHQNNDRFRIVKLLGQSA